ncbi:MAG: carbamoyltransferase C-terminal domain-containing protein [Saprospiraceae bacterium]
MGARSILANPASPDMQRKLNLKVKFREDFRPFAPVMLKEEAVKYFDCDFEAYLHAICQKVEALNSGKKCPITFLNFTESKVS